MLKYRSIPVDGLSSVLQAVVGLTALRVRAVPHLSIEEFAPKLLGELLDVLLCEEPSSTAAGGTLEQLQERVRASLREHDAGFVDAMSRRDTPSTESDPVDSSSVGDTLPTPRDVDPPRAWAGPSGPTDPEVRRPVPDAPFAQVVAPIERL